MEYTSLLRSFKLKPSYIKYYIFGFVALVLASFLHLVFGSAGLSLEEIISAFLERNPKDTNWIILSELRLPRIVVSCLVGASLSVAGLQMQTLFRNALAGPSVLGISTGASMGVAIYVLGTGGLILGINSSWGIIVSAILGAVLVMKLILLLSTKLNSNAAILIVGIMIGSITASIVGFLQFVSNAEDLQSYIVWTLGSMFVDDWNKIYILAGVTFVFVSLALILRNELKLLLLPDHQIEILGVKVKHLRFRIIIITCILAGVSTAFCGPISFVGLAVPHAVRFLTGEGNPSKLLGLSVLYGMLIMVLCDFIASVPGSDLNIPINIITSIIGAPLVIVLILRSRLRHG